MLKHSLFVSQIFTGCAKINLNRVLDEFERNIYCRIRYRVETL